MAGIYLLMSKKARNREPGHKNISSTGLSQVCSSVDAALLTVLDCWNMPMWTKTWVGQARPERTIWPVSGPDWDGQLRDAWRHRRQEKLLLRFTSGDRDNGRPRTHGRRRGLAANQIHFHSRFRFRWIDRWAGKRPVAAKASMQLVKVPPMNSDPSICEVLIKP